MAKSTSAIRKGFKSPEGKVYGPIYDLPGFCKEFDLVPSNMILLDQKKIQSSKGWTLPEDWELDPLLGGESEPWGNASAPASKFFYLRDLRKTFSLDAEDPLSPPPSHPASYLYGPFSGKDGLKAASDLCGIAPGELDAFLSWDYKSFVETIFQYQGRRFRRFLTRDSKDPTIFLWQTEELPAWVPPRGPVEFSGF